MSRIKVGITGQEGFIGSHMARHLSLDEQKYELVVYNIDFFKDETALDAFVKACDVIIHLAAMNRHESEQVIYDTNVLLNQLLIDALIRTASKPHLLFSSSIQEDRDNLYGMSKKVGREMLSRWAEESGGKFTALIIPNVFGPFGNPYYNSVIATFCHQLINNEEPTISGNNAVDFIYVDELVNEFLKCIGQDKECKSNSESVLVPYTKSIGVYDLYIKLKSFKKEYFDHGIIPTLEDGFDLNLFNTFRSFIDHKSYFPREYVLHSDSRGHFVELVKLNVGGQISFSTTVPGISRGNHFHTRKIERFSVISGKARIELRKIDSDEKLIFDLDGEKPAYVDMPIWYTHNISNTGETELLTVFWINEFYNPADADTYFVEV